MEIKKISLVNQKIKVKSRTDGKYTYYAIKTHFNEDKDIIQYLSSEHLKTNLSFARNGCFDHHALKELVDKNTTEMFKERMSGSDEISPVFVKGIGWVGAGHGAPHAVVFNVENHNISYDKIATTWTDCDNVNWHLICIPDNDTLVFISQIHPDSTKNVPEFYKAPALDKDDTYTLKYEDITLKTKNILTNQMFYPAISFKEKSFYVVNDNKETIVLPNEALYEGEYAVAKEIYAIKNPATIADALKKGMPYSENPNLGIGEDMIILTTKKTFYPDGSIINDFELEFSEDVIIERFGGIQFLVKNNLDGLYIYIPNSKEFEELAYDRDRQPLNQTVKFNFSKPHYATLSYPNSNLTKDLYKSEEVMPNRRCDFYADENGKLFESFVGGYLPKFDGIPSRRNEISDQAYFLYPTRKGYPIFADEKFCKDKNVKGTKLKGTAYMKWIDGFEEDFSASYYTIPYKTENEDELYLYFDIFEENTTKKYDISEIPDRLFEVIEQTDNLSYEIENEILTITSKDTSKEAAALVIKAIKKMTV